MAERRRVRRDRNVIIERRWTKSWAVVGFLGIAMLGYIAGTFHAQTSSTVAPLFGVKSYSGTLDLSSVQKTYQELKANFDGVLDDQKLIEGASRGLVAAAGDEYTVYMDAADSSEFNNQLTGNIGGGIGVEVGLRNEQVTILRILKDNPAEKAGVGAGDVVVKVNDESIEGWTVDQTVSKIRGESGTTVKVTVLRDGQTKDFTITRAIINNPSVYTSIEGELGIMTITRFDEDTASQARAAAQEFVSKGVKKVILDLRGNGGGYLSAAQAVAGLWLENKVVVTERTNGLVTDELKSGSNATLKGLPTVVLVNASSASASEIVAGALQDHGVAKLVGDTTFGKGSVQKLIDLPDGAELKVTVARWYTPNGKNISEQGIAPDQAVTRSTEEVSAGRDPQLDAAKSLLK